MSDTFSISNINSMCLDLLKEIGNIGSGNAATSLSQMINMKVDMQVPNVEVMETEKVVELFTDQEEITVGVYIDFTGDIQGVILTLLDQKSAGVLIKALVGKEPENYMFSSLFMNISIPSVSIDMVSSILSVPAVEYGIESDKLILIENKLDLEGENVNCYFFFMPDLQSFEKLFVKLGVL